MERIVMATNNVKKAEEFKNMLSPLFDVISLKELDVHIDVIEDGNTFEENAYKKAKEIYEVVKMPVLADDSGLCIDILDGWPGLKTARVGGTDTEKHLTAEQINTVILKEMSHFTGQKRNCSFQCALCYYDGTEPLFSKGVLSGKIATHARGEYQFGFNPIFELENGFTLAEMGEEYATKYNARRMACMDLMKALSK